MRLRNSFMALTAVKMRQLEAPQTPIDASPIVLVETKGEIKNTERDTVLTQFRLDALFTSLDCG